MEPEIGFDPDKPFHRLVVAYGAQVHGFLDLVARGLREEYKRLKATHRDHVSEDEIIENLCAGMADDRAEQTRAVLKSEAGALLGVQRLGTQDGTGIKVNTRKLAHEVFLDHRRPLTAFAAMSAGSLLILAWESTLTEHSQDPLWEFLRHCRNACAHREGSFNFLYGEPRRPASWRSLNIDSDLQGTPLFWDRERRGLIGPGDALYLLADIESKFY